MKKTVCTAVASFAITASALSTGAFAGEFAQTHYTTPLADVCPSPLIIQKDWLMQVEQGPIIQMIGSGGTMETGVYKGPLGSTGIELMILEGGGGIGMGDGETAFSTLFTGNSKAGVLPHLGYNELDNAFIFSERFPTVGIFAPLDVAPTSLFWDQGTYPDGFATIDDLKAFAESDAGKIYLSTITRTFGKFFVESGIPSDVFIEGYRGDGENFLVNNGTWLNQGFSTSEVYKFANGNNWEKPIDFVSLFDLGYTVYTGMLSVSKNRLEELSPCFEKVVPIMQQAAIDFANDPAEVIETVVAFNEGNFSAPWWNTSLELSTWASNALVEQGLIGNGPNDVIGDFDMDRSASFLSLIQADFDDRAMENVTPDDVITNQFIDPSIGFK
jgi:hypothetical protein